MNHSSASLCASRYHNIKRIAYREIQKERWTNTYHATDLAHDAMVKLVGSGRSWPDHQSFISAAFGWIQRILVDRARRKNTQKRSGKSSEISLGERTIEIFDQSFGVLEVEELIDRYIDDVCPVRGTVIRMRWMGYDRNEIIEALEISAATYDRYLNSARKRICIWLLD